MKLTMQRNGASAQCTMAGDEEKNSSRHELTFSWQSQRYSNFKDCREQRIEELCLVLVPKILLSCVLEARLDDPLGVNLT